MGYLIYDEVPARFKFAILKVLKLLLESYWELFASSLFITGFMKFSNIKKITYINGNIFVIFPLIKKCNFF